MTTATKPKWWTATDGGSEKPYSVYWFDEDVTGSKNFGDEDEASEWGHANLGERVNREDEAR